MDRQYFMHEMQRLQPIKYFIAMFELLVLLKPNTAVNKMHDCMYE